MGVISRLFLAGACVTIAGCAADGVAAPPPDRSSGPTSTSPPTTIESSPPESGRGWIDGEPAWHAANVEEGGTADVAASSGGAPGAPDSSPAIAYDEALAAGESTPGTPVDGGQIATSPRAGSVDDNADFDGYLDYCARIDSLGIVRRGGDATGRVVVTVTGADEHPVHGAVVTVSDPTGANVAALRTTADGTARFMPAMWGQPVDGSWTFAVGDVAVDAPAGASATLTVAEAGTVTGPVPIDVLFLLDATGSMGDEIDQLKGSIDSVAARVAALGGTPDVRFAMTIYRDEGDTFVTSTFDFTADVTAFRTALAEVVADGGGDYPEALDEGFADALGSPAWRDPSSTLQFVFLVADAPPQVARQVPAGYDATLRAAVERGIKVFPIASSESDDQAEAVFRQIAQATGARFVFLSYGAGGAALGSSTDIAATDYEELALDDLVVRLVAEEMAALTGIDEVVPPPGPTTTSIPAGQ